MRKYRYITVTLLVLAIGVVMFFSCEKLENKSNSCTLKSLNFGDNSTSYTGETFNFVEEYENPFNSLGEKHNQLVAEIFQNWDSILNISNDTIVALFAYAVPRSEELYNVSIFEEFGVTESDLVNQMIDNFLPYADDSYMDMVEDYFIQYYTTDVSYFLNDVNLLTYGNEVLTSNNIRDIQLIEQKIANSNYSQDLKNDCLKFCAVYKYSLINLIAMESDPNNVICYGKVVTGGRVMADASGALQGGYAGAQAGVAGGPGGVVVVATVGALCGGALATAVHVGIGENIEKQIDKGLDALRAWWND